MPITERRIPLGSVTYYPQLIMRLFLTITIGSLIYFPQCVLAQSEPTDSATRSKVVQISNPPVFIGPTWLKKDRVRARATRASFRIAYLDMERVRSADPMGYEKMREAAWFTLRADVEEGVKLFHKQLVAGISTEEELQRDAKLLVRDFYSKREALSRIEARTLTERNAAIMDAVSNACSMKTYDLVVDSSALFCDSSILQKTDDITSDVLRELAKDRRWNPYGSK